MPLSLNCPICHAEVNKLVIPLGGRLSCRLCSGPERTRYNPRLNQTNIRDHSTRLTNGKAWEIENRVISKDDNKTIVNRITGKPAQY